MPQAYQTGFSEKRAEYGIDPSALIKVALLQEEFDA